MTLRRAALVSTMVRPAAEANFETASMSEDAAPYFAANSSSGKRRRWLGGILA